MAFDTIYAEGQRRYMETFGAYARQFVGVFDRPDVDNITGIPPVVAIEQKTISQNPRSTVGTVTEIYDYLRLLYAKVSIAYSYLTGKPMLQLSIDEIIKKILEKFKGLHIHILAPLVQARKGHYRELFDRYAKLGFEQMRVDGKLVTIEPGIKLERYQTHDIELWIDELDVSHNKIRRLKNSIELALKYGNGNLIILHDEKATYYSKNLMCEDSGISYPMPEPNTFSFNSPYGACPTCRGLGYVNEIDIDKIFPNKRKSLREGGIAPFGKYKNNWTFKQLEMILKKYDLTLDDPIEVFPDELIQTLLYGTDEIIHMQYDNIGISSNYQLSYDGIINIVNKLAEADNQMMRKWANTFQVVNICPTCEGTRLKKESLYFKIDNKNIAEIANMELSDLIYWIDKLPKILTEKQNLIAKELLKELKTRVNFLLNVGLSYLTLNRPTYSLSGGEAQRIRLATQIGTGLTGVLYILDEPSIGLHPRDNNQLIKSLIKLKDLDNSIIVVEHDRDMMLSADQIVDFGPGAGERGGKVIAQGTPKELMQCNTLTCQYLSGKKKFKLKLDHRTGNGKNLTIIGANGHNLKNITVNFPLNKLIGITGVSGSGKSSLITETLYPAVFNALNKSFRNCLPYEKLEGLENIDKVIIIDQSPIGRTPRSNPATYIGIFDYIREIFANQPESKMRGYNKSRFSFNVGNGRCSTCKGTGYLVYEMKLMDNVYTTCPSCNGKRYNRETLEIRYRGKNISEVLEMTFQQAYNFFEGNSRLQKSIKIINDIGMGYIRLGQSSVTLSGGEAQRVKIATELIKRSTGKTLYILDEPTTGLHFEDISNLLKTLDRLVDMGNTVIVIEHNLEVITHCDHIIDLGPEGGNLGGYVIYNGTLQDMVSIDQGYTAPFIRKYVAEQLGQETLELIR
jgi:excinuclease ABC subunit A